MRYASRYTDLQREAMAAEFNGGATAPRVVELAAAGELHHDGEPLERFETTQSSVRDIARRVRRRRSTSGPTALVDMAPMDAVEQMRRRALTGTDEMLIAEMKKPVAERDPERLKHIYRALRELQYLSGSGRKPGSPVEGKRLPGDYATRGAPAGALLADHRATDASHSPIGDSPPEPPPEREPEPQPETPVQRMRRLMLEDVERHQAQDAGEVEPAVEADPRPRPPVDKPDRDALGRARHRVPEEDTSSWNGAA